MWISDKTLTGEIVSLIPLDKIHRDDLLEASKDGELWKLWFTFIPSEENFDAYVEQALKEKIENKSIPYVVYHLADKRIIGATRYMNIDSVNHRLEIGHTWYSKSYQRSSVNAECKMLLMTEAFENLKSIAVEFRTNWHNHASRAAIEKLGAKQDGVLRNHSVSNGIYRDTVVFSLIENEWPAAKNALRYRLNKYK